MPASPEAAAQAMAELEAREAEVRAKLEEFHRLRREVDELVAALYAGGNSSA